MILSLLEEVGGPTVRCEETEYLEHVLRHNPEKRSYTVHLLNNQNIKKPVPLYNVAFSLRLDITPFEIYTTGGAKVCWQRENGLLHVTLDKLECFDILHIRY